jgi:hypothetical protein
MRIRLTIKIIMEGRNRVMGVILLEKRLRHLLLKRKIQMDREVEILNSFKTRSRPMMTACSMVRRLISGASNTYPSQI